jgi:hypothetical protein
MSRRSTRQRRTHQAEGPIAGTPAPAAQQAPAALPRHSIAQIPPTLVVQPKLTVGPVDDPAEREAERVAEAMVSGDVERASAVSQGTGGGMSLDGVTEQAIMDARGGGSALAPALQQQMSSALGADFSSVRVHTDSQADTLSRSLAAEAFTTGSDIFFRSGAYDPGSSRGQHLLAHELTHVVQQGGQPGGAQRMLVQRRPEHALVTKKGGAGIHKFEQQEESGDKVRKGGAFRQGIEKTVAQNTVIQVDPEKVAADPTYIWALWGGFEGYINKANVQTIQRIGTTNRYLRGNDIYNADTGKFENQALNDEEKSYLSGVIDNLKATEQEAGVQIAEHGEIVDSILKDRGQMKGGDSTKGPWAMALDKLQNVVLKRAEEDKALLVQHKLITKDHVLKSVKFTGSDFHKGGQQVIFLNFDTAKGGSPLRVVYKPSSLYLDSLLFGDDSVGAMLDPGAKEIANYNILPVADSENNDLGYGYMEFVRSGTPETADDLLSVYKSIAANMALSYLVGLDDVHHDNVILLKDRIQVIDMEATTGTFAKRYVSKGGAHQGNFIDQQWMKALFETSGNGGIFEKLRRAVQAGTLTTLPDGGAIEGAMESSFNAIIARAKSSAIDAKWDENTEALAEVETRTVPIPTKAFYEYIIPAAKGKSKEEWATFLNNADESKTVMNEARGVTSNTDDFIKRVLLSPGTFNALKRGDVPYYLRDLGSKLIYDEEKNPIDATGYKKVSQPIDEAMDARRAENHDDADTGIKAIFKAQAVGKVVNGNNDLKVWMPAPKKGKK